MTYETPWRRPGGLILGWGFHGLRNAYGATGGVGFTATEDGLVD